MQSGYEYKYKDSLPVSMLGLVDDIIAITEPGFMAQQMNVLLNVRTAEKGLQFGATKCKSMLIAKNSEKVITNDLYVDIWSKEHKENVETGEADLVERFAGQVPMEKVQEQKYLGFVISNSGNNLANINAMKKKSFGTIKQIFSKLETMQLKKYYFECGLIFMNSMLRSSILYGCESYYNLRETEVRQL